MKIKLGRDIKRNHFDLSHDVNTTSDFGFLQPLFCKEMMPNTKMSVDVKSAVRLAPMVVPTYGNVDYRLYHQFVPYNEIFEPIDNLLSGQSYGTTVKSYIPVKVPSCELGVLSQLLFKYSYMTAYDREPHVDIYHNAKDTSKYQELSSEFVDDFTDHRMNGVFCPDMLHRYDPLSVSFPSNPFPYDTLHYTFNPITLDGADYVFERISDIQGFFCVKLNKFGSNLRKILIGLGYQVNFNSTTVVSLLPLFAYYKAWFDIFAPLREIVWTDTPAFKILDYFRESGNYDILSLFSSGHSQLLLDFIRDLSQCYYVDNQDFIGAHVVKTASGPAGSPEVLGADGSKGGHPTLSENSQPYIYMSGMLGGAELSMLNRLYKWVNKNTAIGGNIYKFLNTHFGITDVAQENSNKIGTSIIDIHIGDVMSLSGNPGEELGQYAGKGFGYGDSQMLTFESKTFGVWITFSCIVPHGGYTQGLDYNLTHVSRFDFPTPEFDSLGFQVSNKDVVKCSKDLYTSDNSENSAFGYIPRYFEQKVKGNVLNGDMSKRSTRDSLLPYTLDKYINNDIVSYSKFEVVNTKNINDYIYNDFVIKSYDLPAASPVWRIIGKYPWLQNFDRIFSNSGSEDSHIIFNDIDDNFIIHNHFAVFCEQPLLPVSESFETDGQNGNSVTVEKA